VPSRWVCSLRDVREPLRIFAAALALTTLQVALAVHLADGPSIAARWHALDQWDSGWYALIADNGYRSVVPPLRQRSDVSNVAFFPGYPLLVRAVRTLSGVSTETALLLAAQAAACLFWMYVLLLFRCWDVPRSGVVAGLLAILGHPAAFFLVVGYAESLFLAALVGFVFWSLRSSRRAAVVAGLHGIAMTATRLIGIAAAGYPLTQARADRGGLVRGVALSAVACLGVVGFFAYNQWRFGAWDLYMQTARVGWDVTWDAWAFFSRRSYELPWGYVVPALTRSVRKLNLLSVPFTALEILLLLAAEATIGGAAGARERRVRLGLYAVAVSLLFVTVNGRARVEMAGMIRYVFAAHTCLVLAAVHLLSRSEARERRAVATAAALGAVAFAAVGGYVQLWLARLFLHGQWTA
jgi:hypothetical protein